MRQDIHPEYLEIKATCSCGNVILIKSTLKEDISLDVCSACHPFYTGKQKLVDTAGRVERFEKRFGKKDKPKVKEKEELLAQPEAEDADAVKEVAKEKAQKKVEAVEEVESNEITKEDTPKEATTKKATDKKAITKVKKKDSNK
ncbi:MAG TPA: 50S ribosomal protein L31 [Gammaproteobacteria bacterium]|jgi:large subunit ribosomal protein L31|nr:50S ribosomal protein L31 [Gammaproteobacteria bacterium]